MTKKGFTLTEVIVVVAIIVILAGAGITGIFVSINDYNRYRQDLEENGGYHFEADAHEAVENMLKGAGSPIPDNTSFPDPTEITPTPTPANDPDPGDDDDDDETTTTTTVSGDETSSSTTTGGNNSNTVTSSSTSTNAPGSNVSITNDWGGSGQANIKFDNQVTEVTLYVPDGVSVTGCWENGISNPSITTNGNYVTLKCQNGQSTISLTFQANWSSTTNTQIKVYSYTKKS